MLQGCWPRRRSISFSGSIFLCARNLPHRAKKKKKEKGRSSSCLCTVQGAARANLSYVLLFVACIFLRHLGKLSFRPSRACCVSRERRKKSPCPLIGANRGPFPFPECAGFGKTCERGSERERARGGEKTARRKIARESRQEKKAARDEPHLLRASRFLRG